MGSSALVTVVIPVRNEQERIAGCLDSVAAQLFPREWVEVLVVDGGSSDATVEIARQGLVGRGWARAEVVHSPAGDRSSNLNCGLDAARGSVVVRVDARSRIPRHYVGRCVHLLDSRPEVAVVGGRQHAVTTGDGALAVGVARALNNRWGMGLSRYRRSQISGRTDTVYLGAYRTSQLIEAGGWRSDLAVNEDFDLNRRLARFGSVWFDAELSVDYLPRLSITGLVRQYWAFGKGKSRYWRLSGDRPRPRQLVLLVAPFVGVALPVVMLGTLGAVAAGVVVGAGLAAAVGVEMMGSSDPAGTLGAHAVALVALTGVAAAWLAGVAFGAVCGMPEPALITNSQHQPA